MKNKLGGIKQIISTLWKNLVDLFPMPQCHKHLLEAPHNRGLVNLNSQVQQQIYNFVVIPNSFSEGLSKSGALLMKFNPTFPFFQLK